jgi:hypothetical protein
MNQDLEELFNKNFGFDFKAQAFNSMSISLRAFEEFKQLQRDFFSYDKRETLFGYLRTYAIEKQFYLSAFHPKSVYSASLEIVNKFKYKALHLKTSDFILNIGRTRSPKVLPAPSQYKKKLAASNGSINVQLTIDSILGLNDSSSERKYGLITYGYAHGVLQHLNLVIPTVDFSKIQYSENLLIDHQNYEYYIPQEEKEEQVATLKDELIKESKNF